MDKNSIRKYAVWARRELIERITQKASQYGITSENFGDPNADNIDGRLLSATEKEQRVTLIKQIKIKGYDQVIEEVAYTWFNRFTALRFMEVNGYLPSHVRIFTDSENNFNPQILTEAINLDLDNLDINKVYALKEANKNEELFKYLLIIQCNSLSKILPGMFQHIKDYTELLLPDHLLREGSVVEQMVKLIPVEDWMDQVQIIGWLYQYYNSEPKDKVFADLKKNIKVTKEKIPAATQLFTPDWIVRYMVENSLGRLWLEGHPDKKQQFLPTVEEREIYADSDHKNPSGKWQYYLEEPEQEKFVQNRLSEICKEYTKLTPEDILCVDPCSGSGHILSYMFDVLFQIYQSYGYTASEAVANIISKNLWGLDIDERAAQLSYFAVMMKARQYDHRAFTRGLKPHVYAICESNSIDDSNIESFSNCDQKLKVNICSLVSQLKDAKEYGSLIEINDIDFNLLFSRLDEMRYNGKTSDITAIPAIEPLINVGYALSLKYDVVVTNPPYMGNGNMNAYLAKFIAKNYKDYKSDLFSAFVVRCTKMCDIKGYLSFLTPYVWMFIHSYEKLRNYIYSRKTIETLIQFEYSAFEEATVPICTFTLKNDYVNKKGTYLRLTDFKGGMEIQQEKTIEAITNPNCGYYFEAVSENFYKIPDSPVAYWVGDTIFDDFVRGEELRAVTSIPKGLSTGSVDTFMRFWYEVKFDKIDFNSHSCEESKQRKYKWFPYAKGGSFRRWNGNLVHVVNWENDGYAVKHFVDENGRQRSRPQNTRFYFKKCMTYSAITSYKYSLRYLDACIFGGGGDSIHCMDDDLFNIILGLLNTKVAQYILSVISPTMNFEVDHIKRIPLITDKKYNETISKNVENNIQISKSDWDSFETSWDFKCHPLIGNFSKISDAYEVFKTECNERFDTLKKNEEELNHIFIKVYDLQDELTSDVEDKDITVYRIFDTSDDMPESMSSSSYTLTKKDVIVSFISYAVGCMFGRYSLDCDGLAYAGGDWDNSKYKRFIPDKDAIIPICDDEYFTDDIVGGFIEFVRIVYGDNTLEENLNFISDALGGSGSSRMVIRNYFLNNFYSDHCKTYKKCPIYWLFDSGRKNGFKCLIYMHRYQPDTIARIRTDYVNEQQSRYHTAINDLEQRLNNASASERIKLNRQLTKLKNQESELRIYEEKIHHLADKMISIDLDDGIKYNYRLFKDVLAKIK